MSMPYVRRGGRGGRGNPSGGSVGGRGNAANASGGGGGSMRSGRTPRNAPAQPYTRTTRGPVGAPAGHWRGGSNGGGAGGASVGSNRGGLNAGVAGRGGVRGRGQSRGRGGSTGGGDGRARSNHPTIKVSGLSETLSKADLETYFRQACPIPFRVIKSFAQGNVVTMELDNLEAAQAMASLSGSMVAGSVLQIQLMNSGDGQNQFHLAVTAYIQNRYDPNLKQLDLSNVKQNPVSEKYSCQLSNQGHVRAFTECIRKNIGTELAGLSLANNDIVSLRQWELLAIACPNITTLSLADNNIALKDLMFLSSLNQLSTLMLAGNQKIVNNYDQATLCAEIRKIFPKVLVIDGYQLPPPVVFDQDDLGTELLPTTRGSFLQEDCAGIVPGFLEAYYQTFDATDMGDYSRRRTLTLAYAPESVMSLASNQFSTTKKGAPLNQYMNISRNLLRIPAEKQRQLLACGRPGIEELLMSIPATKHNVQSNVVVDAFLFGPDKMCVCLHGHFDEARGASLVQRSFSRVFFLIPAAPDSDSALNGWPVVILNDQLTICNRTPTVLGRTDFSGIAVPTLDLGGGLDPNAQQELVLRLRLATKMSMEWSTMCMQESNWNYDLALSNFHAAKASGNIPDHAFTA